MIDLRSDTCSKPDEALRRAAGRRYRMAAMLRMCSMSVRS